MAKYASQTKELPWARPSLAPWLKYSCGYWKTPLSNTSPTPESFHSTPDTWMTSYSFMTPHAPTQIAYYNTSTPSTTTSY